MSTTDAEFLVSSLIDAGYIPQKNSSEKHMGLMVLGISCEQNSKTELMLTLIDQQRTVVDVRRMTDLLRAADVDTYTRIVWNGIDWTPELEKLVNELAEFGTD